MTFIADDSSHLLTILALFDLISYVITAIKIFRSEWVGWIWRLNVAGIVLMIWNAVWTGGDIVYVSSDLWIFILVLLLMALEKWFIGLTLDAISAILLVLFFVAFIFGGKDYGIAYMNNILHYDLPDYAYILLVIGFGVIVAVVYSKWIRDNTYYQYWLISVVMTLLAVEGFDILWEEGFSCGFCTTQVPVYNFDDAFFIELAAFFTGFHLLATLSPWRKKKKEEPVSSASL